MKLSLNQILDKIPKHIYGKDWTYSLTINYEHIVPSYNNREFYESDVRNLVEDYKIKTFNLTLCKGTSRIVFHTGGVAYDYCSKYITLNNASHEFKYTDDICERIFDINEKYIAFSESIKDAYSGLKFF